MVDYKAIAEKINVKEAVIRAVVDVESQGDGFLVDGKPKILFEPHIFWRSLVARKIDTAKFTKGNEDILYPKWKAGAYGKVSEQHARLQRAMKIDKDSAIEAASWGSFQVLGNNWKSLGYKSAQEFADSAVTEQGQVEMFVRFLQVNKLIPFLQKLDFDGFALKYNGPAAKQTQYGPKMKKYYLLWDAKISKSSPSK